MQGLLQRRKLKQEQAATRRKLGSKAPAPPPRAVLLVGFNLDVDVECLLRQLLTAIHQTDLGAEKLGERVIGAKVASWGGPGKPRLMLSAAPRCDPARPHESILRTLDAAKSCDVILAAFGSASLENPLLDAYGVELLSCLKLQGLTDVVGVVCQGGLESSKSMDFARRYFSTEFGSGKRIFRVGSASETKQLIRHVISQCPTEISWRKPRAYLSGLQVAQEGDLLHVAGYVRGMGFTCAQPVHLTGIGDFVLESIRVLDDPMHSRKPEGLYMLSTPLENSESQLIDEVRIDEEYVHMTTTLQPPELGEQTWPTKEELDEAEAAPRPVIRVPKGASETEKAWYIAMQEDGEVLPIPEGTEEEWEELELQTNDVEPEPPVAVQMEERTAEDMDLEDEVDTPTDIRASERFCKYKGLTSFRTSRWDPYEELPMEYSRIYEFESFRGTMNKARGMYQVAADAVASSGHFCCLTLRGAGRVDLSALSSVCVSSLMAYERKATIMHARVQRRGEFGDEEVMASKRDVWLQAGFRRLPISVVYSVDQGAISSKMKYTRSVEIGQRVVASWLGPAMAPEASVLIFQKRSTVHPGFPTTCMAAGNVWEGDPRKIIVKRIILTGYPFKIHKNLAVIRYMFHYPKDVQFFKPLELETVHGKRGMIKDSVGLHGNLKCYFNRPVLHSDTVMLKLYKRIFPRWQPATLQARADLDPQDLDLVPLV
ncbi:MAG: uncharacterized protein KVP18_004354 [Porospora cf. gigantea A]|nr:MAG: hypothetical protein KVP18_004354 [Porospora cf. gigantea A]